MTREELNNLTVRDVLEMEEYRREMDVQLRLEENAHTEALRRGRLKRTPLDSLRERKVFNTDDMLRLVQAEIEKSLLGFSSMERQYIHNIGMVVFGRVLNRLMKDTEETK